MAENEAGKWLAGINATVIGGVISFHLLRPGGPLRNAYAERVRRRAGGSAAPALRARSRRPDLVQPLQRDWIERHGEGRTGAAALTAYVRRGRQARYDQRICHQGKGD